VINHQLFAMVASQPNGDSGWVVTFQSVSIRNQTVVITAEAICAASK
jgi:hypothetical protein